jgi:hypothetical protein
MGLGKRGNYWRKIHKMEIVGRRGCTCEIEDIEVAIKCKMDLEGILKKKDQSMLP